MYISIPYSTLECPVNSVDVADVLPPPAPDLALVLVKVLFLIFFGLLLVELYKIVRPWFYTIINCLEDPSVYTSLWGTFLMTTCSWLA